jgi:AcrR family transcriptional regulator
MAEQAQVPAGRAPWGAISREDIVQAAVRAVAADEGAEMSIRSLAASLGVAPMSLYRHIRDKDDLLDEVVDRLLADVWRAAAGEEDWQAWTVEAASRAAGLPGQPARGTARLPGAPRRLPGRRRPDECDDERPAANRG